MTCFVNYGKIKHSFGSKNNGSFMKYSLYTTSVVKGFIMIIYLQTLINGLINGKVGLFHPYKVESFHPTFVWFSGAHLAMNSGDPRFGPLRPLRAASAC